MSQPDSTPLPTGRETAESTGEAARTHRDAGTSGIIYASNFDDSEASEGTSADASSKASTSSDSDPSTASAVDDAPSRRLTVTVYDEEWRAGDGSTFREFGAYEKWWTGLDLPSTGEVELLVRLAASIPPEVLGRAIDVARKNGVDTVEVQFVEGANGLSKFEAGDTSDQTTSPSGGDSETSEGDDSNDEPDFIKF